MVAKNNTSGYTGVTYYPRNNKWRVIFRNKYYGYKDTLEEAIAHHKLIAEHAPPKKKVKRSAKHQRIYASMHAEHQVLRAKYRKLLSISVSLSPEARYAFEEEYEAIRLKHYPRVSHAPKDLSSWEARRVAFEADSEHELKRLPTNPEYMGLSAKGKIADLRAKYRRDIADPTLSPEERKHLRDLLSFHIAGINKFKF